MKALRTVILGLIFIGLLLFVYIYEIKGGKARKEALERESKVFPYSPDSIKAIRLKNGFGEVVLERDSTGNWNVSSPISYLADKDIMETMLRDLSEAKWVKTVVDSAENPDEFGLMPPLIEATFTLKNDSTFTLQIGDMVPTGGKYYAKLGTSSKIRLVESNIQSTFNRSLYDVRDKRILDFSSYEVEKFVVLRSDTKISAYVDSSGRWFLSEPIKERANNEYVTTLLSGVGSMRAQKFSSEDTTGWAGFGLNKPTCDVSFILKNGKTKRLIIGATVADNKELYYAYTPDKRPIFAVQKSVVEPLFKPVNDFRNRRLVDLDNIDRIAIEGDTVSVELAKIDNNWNIVKPETALANSNKVSTLISDFTSNTAIDSFYKFDKRKISGKHYIRFSSRDNPAGVMVMLGERKGSTHMYASVEDKNELFLVSNRFFDWTTRGVQYFIERQLFPISGGDIAMIEFDDTNRIVYKITVSENREWRMISPKNVKLEDVKSTLDLLAEFKRLEFYTKTPLPENKSQYGLDNPKMRILMESTKGERIELKIGNEKGPYYYAYIEGKPYLYEISSSTIGKIRDWLREASK